MAQVDFRWLCDSSMPDHPKVHRLAEIMNVRDNEALGIVCALFCRARRFASDGNLSAVTPKVLAGWTRDKRVTFAVLVESGLVDEVEGGEVRLIHGWSDKGYDKHDEKCEKRREDTRKRTEEWRKRIGDADCDASQKNGDASPTDLGDADVRVGDAQKEKEKEKDEDVKDIPADKPPDPPKVEPKKKRPDPTPEAKALEAEVRAYEAQFATRYAQVTGGPYTPGKGDHFTLRALIGAHGRDKVNRATAALFAQYRDGKLVWSGKPKAPTIAVLKVSFNDLALLAGSGGGPHDLPPEARDYLAARAICLRLFHVGVSVAFDGRPYEAAIPGEGPDARVLLICGGGQPVDPARVLADACPGGDEAAMTAEAVRRFAIVSGDGRAA